MTRSKTFSPTIFDYGAAVPIGAFAVASLVFAAQQAESSWELSTPAPEIAIRPAYLDGIDEYSRATCHAELARDQVVQVLTVIQNFPQFTAIPEWDSHPFQHTSRFKIPDRPGTQRQVAGGTVKGKEPGIAGLHSQCAPL